MTVAELIAKLQEMPQDADVIYYDDGSWTNCRNCYVDGWGGVVIE